MASSSPGQSLALLGFPTIEYYEMATVSVAKMLKIGVLIVAIVVVAELGPRRGPRVPFEHPIWQTR
jgi:hypothetical protein